MKKIFLIVILGLLINFAPKYFNEGTSFNVVAQNANTKSQAIQEAFKQRKSDVQVKGQGKVIKILSDDLKGSRHQRFILRLSSGQTLLIAHNIDLAPRINSLQVGDTVAFYGEYEWNEKGGVIHWTHKDPNDRHVHGWLKHEGKVYQ